MNIIISFSGGRTSAFMANLLLQNYERKNLHFVFANTGKENTETLDFINECDKRWDLNVIWIEAVINQEKGIGTSYKVVTYETASRNGEPFNELIKKFGIPNNNTPFCTRDLKSVPIKKYAKDNFGKHYQMAIGIRADERRRVNRLRAEKERWIYPLVDDFPTSKTMVKDFWKSQSFDLQIEDYLGNCDFCFKKSLKKRVLIAKKYPNILDWWEDHEESDEYNFDRYDHTIKDIREMAMNDNAPTLFNDNENGCACFSNII